MKLNGDDVCFVMIALTNPSVWNIRTYHNQINIAEWSGKRGRVRIDKDGGGYMKVRWAIPGFAGKDFGSVPYEKVEPKKQNSSAYQGQSGDPLPEEQPPVDF